MKSSEVLRAARELIPSEMHWWRGGQIPTQYAHLQQQCAVTAINRASNHTVSISSKCLEVFIEANDLVDDENKDIEDWIGDWNDDPKTSFEDLQLGWKRAIALAEEREFDGD